MALLDQLIDALRVLPGVGQKTAQRMNDAMGRLKKSGSVDDAAAVFLASMKKG